MQDSPKHIVFMVLCKKKVIKKKVIMASYNCSDSTNSAYGAGGYGTCTGQSIGAPNTGFFSQFVDSSSLTIVAPLVGAIIIVAITTVIMSIRKKRKQNVDLAK